MSGLDDLDFNFDFNALSDEDPKEGFAPSAQDGPFIQWLKGLLHLMTIVCCYKTPKINYVLSVVDDTRNLRGHRRLMTTQTAIDIKYNSMRFYLVQKMLILGAAVTADNVAQLKNLWNENPLEVYKDDDVLKSNDHRARMQMVERLACCLEEASQTGHTSSDYSPSIKELAATEKVKLYEGPPVECMPFFFAFELVTQDEDQIRHFLYKVGYGDHPDFPALSTLRCLLTHGFTAEAIDALKVIIGDDPGRQETHPGLQSLTLYT